MIFSENGGMERNPLMKKLILASQSPRRRELLQLTGRPFSVRVSGFEESSVQEPDPIRLVRALAKGKAEAVPMAEDEIILGCDTVVALEKEILGKPRDEADAKRMLRALSGRTHSVITGVCIRLAGRCEQFEIETRVTFYPLSEAEIAAYTATPEPYDKAGAYGIQEKGGLFVQRIEGDYSNVVGLPAAELERRLRLILDGPEG